MNIHPRSIPIFILLSICSSLVPFTTTAIGEEHELHPTIALINRVVEMVERRAPDIEWQSAKIGDLLHSGDLVKTGLSSFSLVRFYDNSLLRIRELSEVIIYANRDPEAYHRNIEIKRGIIGFEINKQEVDRFQFTTPSSVASIRGSTGTVAVLPNEFDVLLMLTGNAILRNIVTGRELEVTGGEIAFSYPDGTIEKREVTADEVNRYSDSQIDINRRRRRLEIRTRDDGGSSRRIIIEYEEDETDN